MLRKKVIVKDPNGMHMRPALTIADACKSIDGKITICKGTKMANGCSFLEILLLEAEPGSELEIVAEGKEEEVALNKITGIFESVPPSSDKSNGLAA